MQYPVDRVAERTTETPRDVRDGTYERERTRRVLEDAIRGLKSRQSESDAVLREKYEAIREEAESILRDLDRVQGMTMTREVLEGIGKLQTIMDEDARKLRDPVVRCILEGKMMNAAEGEREENGAEGGVSTMTIPPPSADVVRVLSNEMKMDDFRRGGTIVSVLREILNSPEDLAAFPRRCLLLTSAFQVAALAAGRLDDPAAVEVYTRLAEACSTTEDVRRGIENIIDSIERHMLW